jgi:hypothetical protein
MAFLKGLDTVLKNLNKEIKAIEGRSVEGMLLAVAEIRSDIDSKPPLVPLGETGDLRAGWFAYPLNLSVGPAVIFGHRANYAVFVHEMVGANFQRPGAGAKWLQAAIRNSKERTLKIIAENAKVKG